MLRMAVVGLLLLAGGNVGLIFAERTVSSGLASLVLAVVPLYVALIETFLPGGEPLPARGWLGMAIGFCGLGALLYPSLRTGLAGDSTLLWPSRPAGWGLLLDGRQHRRTPLKLPAHTLVAASWQMLAAGVFSALLARRCASGRSSTWTRRCRFHCMACYRRVARGLHMLIYLLEHVPVAKSHRMRT